MTGRTGLDDSWSCQMAANDAFVESNDCMKTERNVQLISEVPLAVHFRANSVHSAPVCTVCSALCVNAMFTLAGEIDQLLSMCGACGPCSKAKQGLCR